MKILAVAIILSISMPGLAQNHAIGGTYPSEVTTTLNHAPDYVWNNLITYLEKADLTAMVLDKSTGVAVIKMNNLNWSFENKDNQLMHPAADVVWPTKIDWKDGGTAQFTVTPEMNVGELSIHLKDGGAGTTILTVRLHEIHATGSNAPYWPMKIAGKSTGHMETIVTQELNK